MNVTMGLLPPRRGAVAVFGEAVTGFSPEAIAARGVALVPQGRRIFKSLTVRENLVVAARKPDAGSKHAPWTTDTVFGMFPRLAERRNQIAAHLSGGEQQMLAIGRALMGNPRVLLMAVSQDQLALQLMAADPIRIKRIAFGISIATASVAGALLVIIQPVEPSVGREYIGRVFAICVLGGLGSLPGTLVAAMLLGVMESITSTFYGPSWSPAVSFGFLLLTLAFRPAGLFGR